MSPFHLSKLDKIGTGCSPRRVTVGMSPECRRDQARAVFEVFERAMTDPSSDASTQSGYVGDHLNRLLRATLGETVKQLTLRLRLERAAHRLLKEDLSVAETADEAGYADVEAFIKAFRIRYGYSPGRFRNEGTTWHLSDRAVHWNPTGDLALPLADGLELRRRKAIQIVAIPVIGDYSNIPSKWRELARDLPSQLLEESPITVFHDDGLRTYGRQGMRSHIGFKIGAQAAPKGFEILTIPEGLFVVASQTRSGVEHRDRWNNLNSTWVTKRPNKRPQPGFDTYDSLPTDWYQVKANISLGI